MLGSLRFLGTGSSLGVPVIGCHCPVCQSANLRNQRRRCSVLIEMGQKKILIDAGPDHREQALTYGIGHLDGLILTHAHYDHIGGLGDARVFSWQKPRVPCLVSRSTYEEIRSIFPYVFSAKDSPFFVFHIVEDAFQEVRFCGMKIGCVRFYQSGMQVMGCVIGDMAYISDIKEYDDTLIQRLHGISTLIISAARPMGSPMHFSFAEAISFANRLGVKRVYLTHLSHEVEYETEQKLLPQSVCIAYDGLSVSFEADDISWT